MLDPTGGQERGYRRGTENLPGVLGMAAALEACGDAYIDPHVLEPLDALCRRMPRARRRVAGRSAVRPDALHRAPWPCRGLSGSAQLIRFDMAGIAVSPGSACSSGTLKPSHVLEAMGIDDDSPARTIRVSFGWTTTRAEVERFCADLACDGARGDRKRRA